MAVERPTLLASNEGLSDSSRANFEPAANESWEVHSIIVSGGPCDVDRDFDINEDDTWLTTPIPIKTIPAAGEWGFNKLEVEDGVSRLNVLNDSGSAVNVYLMGVVVT